MKRFALFLAAMLVTASSAMAGMMPSIELSGTGVVISATKAGQIANINRVSASTLSAAGVSITTADIATLRTSGLTVSGTVSLPIISNSLLTGISATFGTPDLMTDGTAAVKIGRGLFVNDLGLTTAYNASNTTLYNNTQAVAGATASLFVDRGFTVARFSLGNVPVMNMAKLDIGPPISGVNMGTFQTCSTVSTSLAVACDRIFNIRSNMAYSTTSRSYAFELSNGSAGSGGGGFNFNPMGLGINTTAALTDSSLTVAGTARIISGTVFGSGVQSNALIDVYGGVSATGVVSASGFAGSTVFAASVLRMGVTNLEKMRIDSNGRVGIANGAPAQQLDVNGSIRTSAGVGTGNGFACFDSTGTFYRSSTACN